MSAAYALLLLGFGLATVVRIAHAQTCTQPDGGPNMILTGSNTFPVADGTKVTFKCERGYRPEGGLGDVICLKGAWTPLRMRCIRKNCGSPGEVTNGQINYDEGTEFGDKITITCDPGYILVGRHEIICGDQGWLDRLPICEVVVCSPPASIVNGYFTPPNEHYQYSEVVQYSCQGDYVLNGSKELTCKENRQFEPGPPTCVYVQCNNPDINNGQWAFGSRPPYKHKSSVILQCNPGHYMIGLDKVTCGINSQWAPPLPECKTIVCMAPEVKDGEVEDGAKLSYKYLETVTFKCKTGFEMRGESTLTCRKNNQWSPAPPVCAEIVCRVPEVKDGEVEGGSQPSYKYLDSVTFKCKTGFEMKGESTLTCRENNQWSPAPPICTQIECKAPEVKDGKLVVGSPPTGSYKYLDSVTFECKTGYKMKGESTLTCREKSQWSPAPPECTLVDSENTGHQTTPIVFGVLGVLGAIVAGICIFCWIQKKKKCSKELSTEAPREETVALSQS